MVVMKVKAKEPRTVSLRRVSGGMLVETIGDSFDLRRPAGSTVQTFVSLLRGWANVASRSGGFRMDLRGCQPEVSGQSIRACFVHHIG